MSENLKQSRQDIYVDAVITAILSIVLLLTLYPLIYVVSASFSDPMMIVGGKVWLLPVNITLDGYKRVFENKDLLIGYKNSIIYTIVGTTVSLAMTICGAYPLSRKDFYGRNLFMAYFTFTMFFHGGMIPNYLLMKSLGLINNFWVMIIPGAVGMWNLIIMRTFFQTSIPQELYEASFIDGCSNTKALIKIVLPLSKPVIAVTVLFYSVGNWNEFFNGLLYLTDRNKFPLQVILREILLISSVSMTQGNTESGLQQLLLYENVKYAVIIFASVPVLMLYPVIQKYFVKGVMIGAIKG